MKYLETYNIEEPGWQIFC